MKNKSVQTLVEFIENSLNESTEFVTDSIDDQVDSILLKYESDCILDFEIDEARLFEAPGDNPQEDDVPADNSDAADLTGDKDDEQPDVERDPLQPRIDLRKFAGKVSRLASNYDSLLNMPIAIVSRAKNYLEQNYNQAVADEFAEIMEREFDVSLEPSDTTEPREKPMATGAAASGLN